jgi:hypothetical protein
MIKTLWLRCAAAIAARIPPPEAPYTSTSTCCAGAALLLLRAGCAASNVNTSRNTSHEEPLLAIVGRMGREIRGPRVPRGGYFIRSSAQGIIRGAARRPGGLGQCVRGAAAASMLSRSCMVYYVYYVY